MDEQSKKKAIIGDKEYDLPDGIEPLGDDGLYAVDWNLTQVADDINVKVSEGFQFFNPRHLGNFEVERDDNKIERFLGQGFDKESMNELLTDIAKHGQQYPLLGYWVIAADKDKDGKTVEGTENKIKVRVNDGERRWRCINRLIEKNEKVWSAKDNAFMPAREVYARVLCRVTPMTEEEAFQRACAVSETAVKWGDGAQARLVKVLYDNGKKDDEICKLLNKSKQWLAETYSLNELDEFCFSFLLQGKINRKVALDLVKIKDEKTRQRWLKDAWKDAVEQHERLQAKTEKALDRAVADEELAEAEVEEARLNGASPETIAELEKAAVDASEKTKRRKETKAASAKPMVKGKGLRRASGGALSNALRAPKIKKKLEAVQDMIEKNDTSKAEIIVLTTLKVAYQCILDGVDDIEEVLAKLK